MDRSEVLECVRAALRDGLTALLLSFTTLSTNC
jgi:hypothetical protein